MRGALIWLNVYGREAVQHKLKNRLKMYFLCFLAVLELMSDSLTAIYVEPYQCPLHQSILPKDQSIKCSWKNIENRRSWKTRFFSVGILNFFCYISVKKAARLYEVSFFSALWMVFPESLKRSCPNFYAHDCRNIFSVSSCESTANYRASHSEMSDSEWLLGVERLIIFSNYGG